MRTASVIWSLFLFFLPLAAQSGDTLLWSGQITGWMGYRTQQVLPMEAGLRYLPALQYEYKKPHHRIDLELSANAYASVAGRCCDSISIDGRLKPYRAWARYAWDQAELRLGLQKISFGSAVMFRPLMWFDRIDPRDPLQMTDGVWGLMGRYYWLNNANLWLWTLWPSSSPKSWEWAPSASKIPEIGGRFQHPLPGGEFGLTTHWRMADPQDNTLAVNHKKEYPEYRLGLDAKWDAVAGLWLESSWTHAAAPLGVLRNQVLLTLGVDYTFSLGNGLHVVNENLIASMFDTKASLQQSLVFSGISLSYPLSLLDQVQTMVFHDWKSQHSYAFININRKYDQWAIHLMAYWNPTEYLLPTQQDGGAVFAGRGLQCMLVYHH